MLALAASAGGSGSSGSAVRITGMSHTHPAGSTFSWVCAKARKTGKKKATLTVTGAGAAYPGEKYTKTIASGGEKLIRFKIVAAGPFTFKARQGTKRASGMYTVPDPATGPPNGSFPCK
jgi:hypothetical protein